jgi:endonuclease YncB( thermonuclease family)
MGSTHMRNLIGRLELGAHPLTGRASVTDGDTIEIHGERIRILDIDAPESRQTCTAQDVRNGVAVRRHRWPWQTG